MVRVNTLTDSPAPLAREVFGPVADASAPVLILSHDITDSAASWVEAVDLWTAQGYRVLALDARGHGASPRWEEADLASAEVAGKRLVQDLEDVLVEVRAHGLRGEGPVTAPVVLVGHSMGGVTSLVVASRHPELVSAVVAEDPFLPASGSRRRARTEHLPDLREIQEVVADPQAYYEDLVRNNPTWSHREVRASVQGTVDVDQAFLRTGCMGPVTSWDELVEGLTMPVLLVTGTQGSIVTKHVLADITKRLPTLSTAIIEGAPHWVRRTFSGRFHSVVDPWLRQHT